MLKNTIQGVFNEIKGELTELNKDSDWCNITLKVGHSNKRKVNLVCKRLFFDENLEKSFNLGDKVSVRFYISSRKKHDRYYTNATILAVDKL